MELIIRQNFHNLVLLLLLLNILFPLKHRALNHSTTILILIPDWAISGSPAPCCTDLNGVISSKYLTISDFLLNF